MAALGNNKDSTSEGTGLLPIRRSTTIFLYVALLMTADFPGTSANNYFASNHQTLAASLSGTITRSIPALSVRRTNKPSDNARTIEVSTRTKKRPNIDLSTMKRPKIDLKKVEKLGLGVYYGLQDNVITKIANAPPKPKRMSQQDAMIETLEEIRRMREEMTALREEMRTIKNRMGSADGQAGTVGKSHEDEHGIGGLIHRKMRQRDLDKVGIEVERWAEEILFKQDGEGDGWTEVACQKLLRKKFNPENTIKCYLKWMKDPRGDHASMEGEDPERDYPCIKVYATIDAPIEDVCAYLSEENNLPEYNDLVVKHRDIEEISPHSKITWGQTPQILFIKPRDFVTFCHHRWLQDGTQVVINQAIDHPDLPANNKEVDDKPCRAYALRGANFISRDPDDPNKTRFALCAHANPGGIPAWATKTAINALAPIEPFKLFYKINKCVKDKAPLTDRTEMVSSISGRTTRPAGLSQMGYACFWPNGGGMKEGALHRHHPQHAGPPEESQSHEEGPNASSSVEHSTATTSNNSDEDEESASGTM